MSPCALRRQGPARQRPARRLSTATGLAALLLVAGCGSGQRAQTYQERTTADATNEAIGTIAVRNLAVSAPTTGTVYPVGSSAPVTVTLVNEGGEPDTLVSASSPAASSVVVTGPTPQLQVPRLGATDPTYGLLLQGLTRPLQTGTYIELTMRFQRNGEKTMLVPVQVKPEQVARTASPYKVAETDSEGNPLPEGDNVPEGGGNPKGDNLQDAPVSE